MRNMNFMLTTRQIKDKSKSVTRRLGWWFLKPGDVLNACEKCQGLKKGEKVIKLCQIRVLSTRGEKLFEISESDVIAEGFPNMTPFEFVNMFSRKMKTHIAVWVNRIEFEYLEDTK